MKLFRGPNDLISLYLTYTTSNCIGYNKAKCHLIKEQLVKDETPQRLDLNH